MTRGGGFSFPLGLHTPRGPGDDQSGPPFVPAEVQNLLSLSRIFFSQFPDRFDPSNEAFCTARNEKPGAWAGNTGHGQANKGLSQANTLPSR